MKATRVTRWPTAGVALAVALIIVVFALCWTFLRSTLVAGEWSRRAVEVLRQTEVVLGRLRDAETGQRGYVLTGDEAYLEPYTAARARIGTDLERLRALTAGGDAQQERLARLERVAGTKLDELATTIRLRQERGLQAALAVVDTDVGKQAMDAARALVAEMNEEERRLLQERLRERERLGIRTGQLLAVGGGTSVLIIVGCLLVLRRQLSERERAERATRESEQRLRTTLSSIGDAVIATDTEGRVSFMNPVAIGLTGWPTAEARGRPLHEVFVIVNEATRQPVENPVARVLREGHVVGLANHTIVIARDGRESPIDDSAAPIRDGDGEIMGVVLVFRDVSERKEAEDARVRYVRAEAANEAKDTFLAVLSHELRSPLNAMLGWVRLVKRPDRPPDVVDRAMEVLERNIGTQTRLINELLDVSRIVAGKLHLELAPVDLVPLLDEVVESTRVGAATKQLTVTCERPAEPVLWVRGDRERLQQILTNVLGNAVKFTPAGGRIEVTVRREANTASVRVADSGDGIAPAFLPHVFDRFRQADSSMGRAHGGLGLGLAIVRHLVEQHGGRVEADSPGPGLGATFTVTLPMLEDQSGSAAVRAADAGAAGLEQLTVLVVEDDRDTLDALRLMLEASGARVSTATRIADARVVFAQARPDVIVSDISMPGGDGYDFIRSVRASEPTRTPAIAMTGLASKEDRAAAFQAGFDAHLTKPVDPDALVRCVRALVSARSRLSA